MTTRTFDKSQEREILGLLYLGRDEPHEERAVCFPCFVGPGNLPDQEYPKRFARLVRVVHEDDKCISFLRCDICDGPLLAVIDGVMQDLPYHDDEAYATGKGVCFIPEDQVFNARYTRADYLELADGSVKRADTLYRYNTQVSPHVSPQTLIDEEEEEEEDDICLFGEPVDDYYIPEE